MSTQGLKAPRSLLRSEMGTATRAKKRRVSFVPHTVTPEVNSHLRQMHLDWVTCSEVLPDELCDHFIAIGRSFPLDKTTVVGQDRLKDHRVGKVHILPSVAKTRSLYRLLWETAVDATERHYGLTLSGISRMPHYVEYHAGRGHFHWHNDYSHESVESPRKLTVIIQLSDSDEYKGGDLEVFGAVTSATPRERGAVICLPSFVPHRVTPVKSGVRRVIVAWIAGPRLI